MALENILGLPVALGLTGAEYFPVVQGGTTKRAATGLLDNFANTGGTQSANTFFGGPATGSASAPAFRVLVPADLPGNAVSAFVVGDLLYASSTTALARLADVATGRVLTSGGVGVAPAYSATPVLGASGTVGSLTFGNATSGLLTLQPVTGALRTVTLSLPAATDTLVGRNTTDTLTNKTLTAPVLGIPASGTLTNCTGLPLTSGVSGVLPVANGGTNIASYAVGDILYASGATTLAKLPDVAVGSVLVSGGVTTAPAWSAAPTLTTSLTCPLLIGGSGTTGTQLTVKTTTGNGTTDQLVVLGGNNGGTTFATLSAVGLGVGAAPSAAWLTAGAGTTAKAAITLTSGTNLTSAAAGAVEYDGVQDYFTIDTSSGRGARPVEQYFHLTADGSAITTIANFFGSTSNISLVASAYYIIDIYVWFLKTTADTVVWTLTNSAAPTSQNIYYEMSPITGVVAPPGTATMLIGQVEKDATAAKTITTGTLSTAVEHYAHFKIWLQNGTGTNLKIQATATSGSLTPRLNSYWICRRMSPNNIGTFAA